MDFIYVILFALPVFPALKMIARPKSKVCPKCGARLQGDYPVCSVCGRHIGTNKGGFGTFVMYYAMWLVIIVAAFAFLATWVSGLFN